MVAVDSYAGNWSWILVKVFRSSVTVSRMTTSPQLLNYSRRKVVPFSHAVLNHVSFYRYSIAGFITWCNCKEDQLNEN